MNHKMASSEFSKRETQMGVAGLLFGIVLVLGQAVLVSRGGQEGSASTKNTDSSKETTTGICGSPGQIPVNNGSVCRPEGHIDFYLIEDYSFSASIDLFEPITSAIQRDFFLEGTDRIACLGFATSLFPKNQTPSFRSEVGCQRKKDEIAKDRKAAPGRFNTTRFGRLFDQVRERLAEERISGEPKYFREEIHRDLVVVLSDGLQDTSSTALNCSKEGVEALPRGVMSSLRLLQKDLSAHKSEVWLFLVLVNQRTVCLADLEKRWQSFRGEGLNVITFDPTLDDPATVPARIFALMEGLKIKARPKTDILPNTERKSLDSTGSFEMRYRIDEVKGNGIAPIRNTKIRIERAWLTRTETDHHLTKTENDHHLTETEGDHQDEIQLTPLHYEYDYDLVKGTWIDATRDNLVLQFGVAPSSDLPDPYETYTLDLELGGIAEAERVEIHPRWQSKLHQKITIWKNVTLATLVALLLVLSLRKFFREINSKEANPTGTDPPNVSAADSAPRLMMCFSCLVLLVLALASLIFEPRVSFDDRSLTTGLSILAVFFLQARHHLITECLLALLIAAKGLVEGLS